MTVMDDSQALRSRSQQWLVQQPVEVQDAYRARVKKRNMERYRTDPEYRAACLRAAAESKLRQMDLKTTPPLASNEQDGIVFGATFQAAGHEKGISVNIKGPDQTRPEEPLFQSNQIGELLGLTNIRMTLKDFDEDEVRVNHDGDLVLTELTCRTT